MNGDKILSEQDVINLPADFLPYMCLAHNPLALFGFGICVRTHGNYSHFQWKIRSNVVATQGLYFKEVDIFPHYAKYQMKFVYNEKWTPLQRAMILASLDRDLAKPWWMGGYDVLQIVGQGVGLPWIQGPFSEVCSDSFNHVKVADSHYDLKYTTPTLVNQYTKEHQELGYKVAGIYLPPGAR